MQMRLRLCDHQFPGGTRVLSISGIFGKGDNMAKRPEPGKWFMLFSFVLIGAGLTAFGVIFSVWEMWALGPMVLVFGIGSVYRQRWATYLLIAVAGAVLLDIAYYTAVEGRPIRSANNLAKIVVIVLAAYSVAKQQAREQVRKVRKAQAIAPAAARALEAAARGDSGADADDAPVDLPVAKEAQPHVFRSIVLLTKGAPVVDSEKVKQRLGKWLNVRFTERSDEASNFFVGDGNMYMAKLHGTNIYMVTLLNRPYWDSEDLLPYEYLLNLGNKTSLLESMKNTQGAIMIDAHIGSTPQQMLGLAKLAVSLMASNTTVLLSPAAYHPEKITTELAQKLIGAKQAADLLGPLCSVVPLRMDEKTQRVQVRTRGLAMFDLPDVLVETQGRPEQVQQAMEVVQSVSMYQVQRGKALPPGDTCSVPDAGSYRVAAHDDATIRLEPIAGPVTQA